MSGSYTEMDVSKIFTAIFLLTEVYSTHGSCNAPEGFPNARSIKSMEGVAHFDDGDQIKYRCDDGFTLVSSDGTSTCQNGRWTSVDCIQGCNEIPNADIYIVDKDGVMGKEPVTFVKHGQQVSIQCKEHFTLYKNGAFYDTDGTSSTCAVGSWSPAFSCKKDSCCLQVPDKGYLAINGARREDAIRIDSGFEGSIVCEEGFAFFDNDRQEFFEHFPVTCFGHILNASIPKCVKVTHYELEVKVGNSQLAGSRGQLYVTMLSEQGGIIHKMAFEKPVFKGLFPGQLYTLNSFTSGQNGKVWIIKLQLRHEQGINAFLEIDHIRLTIQHAADNIKEEYDFSSVGRLNNKKAKLVRPDEPCTLPAIEHTRDNEIPKELANNKQVTVECKNGYEMMGSDIANQNIKTNCNKGNLAPSLDNIKCIPKGCSGTSNANVYRTTASGDREEEPASSFDHEEYAIVKCHDQYVLSQDSKPVRDRESKPTRCMFGRWEPEYSCKSVDSFYSDYAYVDYESVYSDYAFAYEVESDEFFHDYPGVDEVEPEKTCPNPANGRLVRSYLSYYNVVCDDGYELYVVENDDDYKCSNGKWMSKNFGIEAKCNEKNCEITDEILAVMKVFNRVKAKKQYVSGVRKITPNQKYYFDCKQENHEPVTRLFNCSRGNWTAIERDPNWKMQIDEMEPSCRKALCDPACQFGGTCVKDGFCKCVPGTTGKACEIPVCNPACARNGGKCEAPNTCRCEEPRYGINCEQVGCDRPNLPVHVIMKGTKNFFEDGDVLSSDQLTCSEGYILSNTARCIGNLTWSGKPECLKETHFELEMKVGNSQWAGSWGQLYVTILSEQGEIIHRMAFEIPAFKVLSPGNSYTLSSSTTGETRKVGHLKLSLGPGNRGINDNLEIDHIRLTIQRDADNTKEEYDFSSVGWLNNNQAKLVRPDTGVFRLKYRLGDSFYAGSSDTLHVSFEGSLGTTPFYMMSRGRINGGQTYYEVIDGEYVGQIHTVTIVKEKVNMVPNDIHIDYIKLTVSHEDKEEKYILRNVGWIDSQRKEIKPEITADQPEMPACQDDFDVSPGWVGRNLPHSEFTKAILVKSDEDCKNLCRKDGRCKVAAVSGRELSKYLTCKIVYNDLKSAFNFRGNGLTHRLYTRKC